MALTFELSLIIATSEGVSVDYYLGGLVQSNLISYMAIMEKFK